LFNKKPVEEAERTLANRIIQRGISNLTEESKVARKEKLEAGEVLPTEKEAAETNVEAVQAGEE